MDHQTMPEATERQYGPDAQTEKDYGDLTNKQRSIVDGIIDADVDATDASIADAVNCSGSYVAYVRDNFPHIIDERRGTMAVTTDGGQPHYTIQLNADDAWKAIRLLPEDLSETIYRQVRKDDGAQL